MKALQILRPGLVAVAVLGLAMESSSARAQIVNSPGQANIGGVGPQTMGLGGTPQPPLGGIGNPYPSSLYQPSNLAPSHAGIGPGISRSITNPSGANSPSSITPAPYSLPGARGLRDPLGIGTLPRGRRPARPPTRPKDIGSTGREAIRETLHHHNVWAGVAYFPRQGMYEDAIYQPRRGSYRVQSGGRHAPQGGPLTQAGVLGDRAIGPDGIPRTLRRTTNRPTRDIGTVRR